MEEKRSERLDRSIARRPDVGLREAINTASRTFGDALKRSRLYMAIGIVIALACASWGHTFLEMAKAIVPAGSVSLSIGKSILGGFGYFLDHLSVGFFVSSIAVFFYEWGSDAKHALDLSVQLDELLRAEGVDRIRLGMAASFADHPALQEEHEKLIAALLYLNRPDSRARMADLAFLTLFVEHAANYGNQLRTLREHLANPGKEVGRPFQLDFTKLSYADKILTDWMGLLGEGDRYVTMSNPRTWSALKSGGFKRAGGEAVFKGCRMQRIFIMDHDGDEHSVDDLRNLINHYQFAANRARQGRGTYQIQIAGKDVFTPRGIRSENQHYGIFTARFGLYSNTKDRDKRTSVVFKVKGAEVENFELVAVEEGGELARNFDEIWESLESSTAGPIIGLDRKATDEGAGRFLDAVMAREAALLLENTTFSIDIVSTLETWKRNYELTKFHDLTRDLSVRHLFVLERGEKESDVEKLTAERRASRTGKKNQWEVQVYSDKPGDRVRPWLQPRWQFIETREIGAPIRPLHHCVFNLHCQRDLSDFFLIEEDKPTKAVDFAKRFNDAWEASHTPSAKPAGGSQ
jgi:hypothetical protein